MQDFKKFWRGITYCWLWNCSIFGGYCVFSALLFLIVFFPKFYRKVIDFIVTFWQFYVTTLLTQLWGCTIQVTGDPINSEEMSILISNHRTRVDWNFLWPALHHAVEGKNKLFCSTKFVLKDSIKNIPGAGWVMQLAFYIFLHRNWEKDQRIIKGYVDYVADMAYKHILVLFPEGTDFTTATKQSSDKYAVSNGLPKYKHVLHPRTTGFIYLVDQMRNKKCIDAVYDVTLIYPDECPQNEEELFFKGKFPRKVMAHFVRYPISSLPVTKQGLKEFLEQRWLEKEKTIDEFHSTGRFLHGKILNQSPLRFWYFLTFLVWTMLPLCLYYLFVQNTLQFAFIVVSHTVMLICFQWIPIGVQSFDMLFFKVKKILFGAKNRAN